MRANNCTEPIIQKHNTSQIRPIFYIFFHILGGIALFSLFALAQKAIAGFTLEIKTIIVPITVGTCAGLLVGVLRNHNRQILLKQQQAVQFWQHEKEKTLNILTSISDGLLVTDSSGKIELANNAAEQLLGINKEKLLDTNIKETIQAICPTELPSDLLSDKNQSTVMLNIKNGDNPSRNVQISTSVTSSANGYDNSIVILLHDYTRELLIDKMKAEFISSATHNLKTPITAITGYSELLQTTTDLSDEDTSDFINLINEKAWELDALVNNMLDINRAEAGRKINLTKSTIPVSAVFDRLQQYCTQQPDASRFSFELHNSGCQLRIDTNKVAQALENIIDNAIKFSPKATIININGKRMDADDNNEIKKLAAPDNHGYLVSISDAGVGMTSSQCQKIFEKFYRVDTSDSAPCGIGLGLTLTKNIIEAHGGKIWATSIPDQGTTLSFYLPISDTAEHEY